MAGTIVKSEAKEEEEKGVGRKEKKKGGRIKAGEERGWKNKISYRAALCADLRAYHKRRAWKRAARKLVALAELIIRFRCLSRTRVLPTRCSKRDSRGSEWRAESLSCLHFGRADTRHSLTRISSLIYVYARDPCKSSCKRRVPRHFFSRNARVFTRAHTGVLTNRGIIPFVHSNGRKEIATDCGP